MYALFFLACPLAMGLMMWVMMRGNKQPTEDTTTRQADLTRMQAEIDQLRAADRDRLAGPGGVPLTK